MKRSTLLFVSTNLMLLLIPIFLMLGLRMKITSGDVIDLKARYEAGMKTENNTGPIENVILHSKYNGLSLRLEMDTINKISMDTTTARYTTYTLNNGVLTIDYDFEKDSIENSPIFDMNSDGEREEDANVHRWIVVHTTSSVKKYEAKGGSVEIILSENNLIRNDLEIIGTDSYIDFSSPDRDVDFSNFQQWIIMDSLPYQVKIKLDNSDLSMNLDYVKELDLDLKNTNTIDFVAEFEQLDLRIDRNSPLTIDVAKWDKIKLKYYDK